MEELNILRTLQAEGVAPLQVVPVSSPLLQPVELFQTEMLDGHLMIRAANMKITVDLATRTVVNVSGGGCPDVPYLAREMVGKTLDEAPSLAPSATPCAATPCSWPTRRRKDNARSDRHRPGGGVPPGRGGGALAGALADPTPASQVMEVIERIPEAMARLPEQERKAHGERRPG